MPSPTETRLTREQLYELAWSKPMTKVAAEFGMTSVGLAKHCRKLNVPTPPRGYWARLANGHRVHRANLLPAAATGAATELVLYQREPIDQPRPVRKPQPLPEEVPKVVVPVRVSKLHPTAQAVKHALVRGPGDPVGVVSVLGSSGKVVRVSERWKPRTLRLLHALVTALEAEGLPTRLRVVERPGWEHHDRYHLEVLVENQPVPLLLREKIEFVPQEGAYSGLDNPKAHRPTGRLTLWVAFPAGSRGSSWSDTEGRHLEEQLGEAILSVKRAAPLWVEHEKRMAEERKVWDEERRRIREQERRQQHLESLAEDLDTMSAQWRRAEDLRSFIGALEQKVAPASRDQVFSDWLAWAQGKVAALDPLTHPERVVKSLEPDQERQPEE